MTRFLFFLLHIFFTTQCILADDVGPDFDSQDATAWEELYGDYPYRAYHTIDFKSPAPRKVIDSPACYDGRYMFWTPRGPAIDTPGPMILDDQGEMVWALHAEGKNTPYNFRVQEYKGEPHLTFWLGDDGVKGHGEGSYYVLDSSYQQVAKVDALNGLRADLHELTFTAEGTVLLSIYQTYPLTYMGKRFYIWDCLFQEIDIEKNELLFEWRASDHHQLDESYGTLTTGSKYYPWDWYHLNSVQKDKLGNYLVSARYMHGITYIDGTSGEIIWRLGGKHNMFQNSGEESATDFVSQHHARFHDLTDFPNLLKAEIEIQQAKGYDGMTTQLISIFDNGADDRMRVRDYSRGLLLEISYPTPSAPSSSEDDDDDASTPRQLGYSARVVKIYIHPENVTTDSQGSFEVIPSMVSGQDPTIGIGWGQKPVWTEFTADGQTLCDLHFAPKKSVDRLQIQSYRTFKDSWIGRPQNPPSAALGPDSASVFVSWNGATEVATWRLQHSNEPFELAAEWKIKNLQTLPKKTFETEFELPASSKRYLRILAFDKDARVLGISNTVDQFEWEDGDSEKEQYDAGNNGTIIFIATDAYDIASFCNVSVATLEFVMFCFCATSLFTIIYAFYPQVFKRQQDLLVDYMKPRRNPELDDDDYY